MEIINDRQLLDRIEAFIADHQIAVSRFGLEAMGDGALVIGLRKGRSLSLRNAEKVMRFMEEYRSETPNQASAA